jgi:hypothetical protein
MMRNLRHVAIHLALVAMMVRALLPPGWMPNPVGTGQSAFIICTMDGPVQSAAKDHGPGKPTPDDGRQHEACPFAAAPHFATPSVVAVLLLPVISDNIAQREASRGLTSETAAYAPQAPRAPPSFA